MLKVVDMDLLYDFTLPIRFSHSLMANLYVRSNNVLIAEVFIKTA